MGSAGFRELTGPGGESVPIRDRAGCHMFYTPAPEDTRAACPRTCEAERIAKLTASATM